MARRTLSRGLVVAAATAAMVTTIAPLMTTTANAATATPSTISPSETVIPATQQKVTQLNLSGGQLLTATQDPNGDQGLHARTVTLPSVGAKPVVSDPSPLPQPADIDAQLYGSGTGAGAYTELAHGSVIAAPDGTPRMTTLTVASQDGTIVAANNKYTVYDGSDGKQYVYRNGQATPILVQAAHGVTLRGDDLLSSTAPGVVYDKGLGQNGNHVPLDFAIPCTASELQAAGEWIYWSCGDGKTAGVVPMYGKAGGVGFRVPAGPSVLADGVLVQHDLARGELTATDLDEWTGSGAPPQPSDIAPLAAPADGKDDRGVTFSADPYGGGIAYVDAQQNIHVLDPGSSGEPAHHVQEIDAAVPPPAGMTPGKGTWSGSWLLSRPVTSAKMVIVDTWGDVIAKVPATSAGDVVSVSWDGLASDGTKPVDGTYTYGLQYDGALSPLLNDPTGTISVTGGTDAYRDPRGAGLGSVVTMNSSGYLTTHSGTPRTGSLDTWKSGGSGYATGDLAVPFGALHGNGCDDTLVRTTTGELRDYPTGCGTVLGAANAKYTSLGTGWNQYKTLQYTGDLNGDGRPDLLAWSASTGDLYLYPGTAAGKLGARVLVKANQQYVRFIATGDVNGDGNGDLLAYDHEHTLWEMLGDGKGGFTARTPIWSDWGAGYNAMVGAGDINGDGRPDIVERDSAGKVWMNYGVGQGRFEARQQVGTGWQGYKALY